MNVKESEAATATPRHAERRRAAAVLAWLAVGLGYGAAAFALAMPYRLDAGGGLMDHAAPLGQQLELRLMWIAFMLRVFQAHLGVVLLILLAPAIALRAWRPLLAGIPLVMYSLWPVLADLRPKRPAPPAGPPLRILTSNMLAGHAGFERLLHEISHADADLIALQEFDPANARAIAAALSASHPYAITETRTNNFGIALYARVPLRNPRSDVRVGTINTPQIRAEIEHAGRRLTVYVIHTFPAEGLDGLSELNLGFADLTTELAAQAGPLLVCGDFNAPLNTQPMRHLLDQTRLHSAHELSGFGPASTWPNLSVFRYLPGVRIDHVLLSAELTAVASRVLPGHGSDHRPVLAEIAWQAVTAAESH